MGLAVLQNVLVHPKVDVKRMQNKSKDPNISPGQRRNQEENEDGVQRFLWQWTGANESILKRPECATDRAKYASIGAIVLFISSLASFSFGYAVFVVSESIILSVLLGLLWGWGIRSLDRLFIISIKKKYRANLWEHLVGAGSQAVTAIPRLGLALVLAMVISKPLELQIFNKELEAEIARVNELEIQKLRKDLYDDEMRALDTEKQRLENEIKLENDKRKQAYNEFICEAEGKCGTGKFGRGPVADEKKREIERIDKNIAKLEQQKKEAQKKIDEANNRLNNKIQQLKSKEDGADGILKRIKTLEDLGKEQEVIKQINLFVTLVFVLLEVSPILAKMFSPYGPYDAIIEREEMKTISETARRIKESKHELYLLEELGKNPQMRQEEIENLKNIKRIELKASLNESQRSQDTFNVIQDKVWETLEKQLVKILEAIGNIPEGNLQTIHSKIIKKMEERIEEKLLQFTDEITLNGKELYDMIKKVKNTLLQEALSNQVRGIANQEIVQEREQQVEKFKAQTLENNGSNNQKP